MIKAAWTLYGAAVVVFLLGTVSEGWLPTSVRAAFIWLVPLLGWGSGAACAYRAHTPRMWIVGLVLFWVWIPLIFGLGTLLLGP
ncbi:hypothetical protein NY035_08605 [Corynebacterium diphtheriae bv. mitis]|uniref:hypothetical protein n=1 Tax=Corynebacterium diphtheriae TaxID=1717 RepID=UPI0002468A8A|nr:hypothetical protein [Corynebacterium diphtheriae]OWN09985.1 hypothetical protein AY479_02705 [Corynebacterium belfantii]AEX79404.1 putative membrane protein [Corynebacterium diphtheriae HC03]AEX81662.1 putative membrane protein [Corynebacterium diphtheriae HC04]AEX83904.1 putative membrane protein [Corynebacterium diphtheriae VA01]KJJ60315.1 hypothetical protein NG01_01870 [Corynebacterium diphtheriae]